VGVSVANTDPATWGESSWISASFNTQANGNDEYIGTISGASLTPGVTYFYSYRWQLGSGAYFYGGIKSDGSGSGPWDAVTNGNGVLTVEANFSGSTFNGWSGGATVTPELVGKYAIGGASSLVAADEVKPALTVSGDNLVLTAIVRTNDANLDVVGEAGGSLTNWSTNGVNVAASPDTNGVPEGHQRQVFSVDRTNSPTRQFLRLKATLAP